MSNVPFLDFQAIKRSYSIDQIMSMTGLVFKKDGESYRCECPVHKGGKRSLVVSPDQPDDKGNAGAFYCFGEKAGGDRVALLAHVRQSKPYAIFKELAEKRPVEQKLDRPKEMKGNSNATNNPPSEDKAPEEKRVEEKGERGFAPIPYLDKQHQSVLALGIPPEILAATGIGFSPRGHHRGRIAIPVRTEQGLLIGYISIEANTSVQLPPRWAL